MGRPLIIRTRLYGRDFGVFTAWRMGGDSCVAGLKGAQRADHWKIVVQARQRGWGVSVCPLRPGCGDDGCLILTPRSGTRHHDVTGPPPREHAGNWTFPLLKPSHEPHREALRCRVQESKNVVPVVAPPAPPTHAVYPCRLPGSSPHVRVVRAMAIQPASNPCVCVHVPK